MSLTNDPRLRQIAKQICRDLRKNQTKAELTFWNAVRNRKILGYKFYRQYPLFLIIWGRKHFLLLTFFALKRDWLLSWMVKFMIINWNETN